MFLALPKFRSLLVLCLSVSVLACDDKNDDYGSDDAEDSGGKDDESGDEEDDDAEDDEGGSDTDGTGTDDPAESLGTAWYFGAEPATNRWTVMVVDPVQPDFVIGHFDVGDLADLSGSSGNDAGPGWGDGLPSADGSRVLVNATSVSRVAVFETETQSLETVLEVGERPVHMFNPNHGPEIWTHADGPGEFYIIDQTSLAVSDPVRAATDAGGHGKLLYAAELGTDYYATQVLAPGIYPIDGANRTVGDLIELCGVPCEDDPNTPEDESQNTCGGTHDKGYNAAMDYVIAQCSGSSGGHFAFVQGKTGTVVQDMVPISGGITGSPDWKYILVVADDGIHIWDTTAAGHNGIDFDHTVVVDGAPSLRAIEFRQNGDGEAEAWIPQSEGTKLVVLNMTTMATRDIEIGSVSVGDGAHAARRGTLGGRWYFTYNNEGPVVVDVETHEATQAPEVDFAAGEFSRVAFAATEHDH